MQIISRGNMKTDRKIQEDMVVQAGLKGDGAVRREGPDRKNAEWKQRRETRRRQTVFSGMDLAMISYGICVIVSAVCSSYGKLAWVGYEGWYMGAISQLLFIWIYFSYQDSIPAQPGRCIWARRLSFL